MADEPRQIDTEIDVEAMLESLKAALPDFVGVAPNRALPNRLSSFAVPEMPEIQLPENPMLEWGLLMLEIQRIRFAFGMQTNWAGQHLGSFDRNTKPYQHAMQQLARGERAYIDLAVFAYRERISLANPNWRTHALEQLAVRGRTLASLRELGQPLGSLSGDTGYFTAKARGFPAGRPSADESVLERVDEFFAERWLEYHQSKRDKPPKKGEAHAEFARRELGEDADDDDLMKKEDALARQFQRAQKAISDPARPRFHKDDYTAERLSLRFGAAAVFGVHPKKSDKA